MSENVIASVLEPETSGPAARKSDHYTTEAVFKQSLRAAKLFAVMI
jgi:hypothetical protein